MLKIKETVENVFKNKIPNDKYIKFLIMGDYLDTKGEDAYGYDANEAFTNFKIDNGNNYLMNTPTLDDWKEFLSDTIINDLLWNKNLQVKKGGLRKWISNLDFENDKLSLSDVKALTNIKEMIDQSDKAENNIVYVQYTCPIRYGDHDNETLVESLKVKDNE